MIGDFMEGAMIGATMCMAVGFVASIMFPPVAILAAAMLTGATQATSTRTWRA